MIEFSFQNKNVKGGVGARRQMNFKNQIKNIYEKMYINNEY